MSTNQQEWLAAKATLFEKAMIDKSVIDEARDLEALVEEFASEMKQKLLIKLSKGWTGWDDTSDPELQLCLMDKLYAHVSGYDNTDFVDVANFAAFLWRLRQKDEDYE